MGFHPGHQLTGAERLGHIVVRSQTQATDLVNVILLGRDHQNRYILFLPDPLAYLEAVHLGQHQVQNNQIIIPRQRRLQPLVSPVADIHLEIAEFQIVLFQVCYDLLVLDN